MDKKAMAIVDAFVRASLGFETCVAQLRDALATEQITRIDCIVALGMAYRHHAPGKYPADSVHTQATVDASTGKRKPVVGTPRRGTDAGDALAKRIERELRLCAPVVAHRDVEPAKRKPIPRSLSQAVAALLAVHDKSLILAAIKAAK